MNLLILLLGVALLAAGGEALIRGALAAAARLSVSPLASGIVIVGFGTSAPEFIVSIDAALTQRPDLAIGNVVGSNIGNVLLILGTCALVKPLTFKPTALRRDAATGLLATVMFIVFTSRNPLDRGDGVIFLALFAAYLGWTYWSERFRAAPSAETHKAEAKELIHLPPTAAWTAASIVAGLVLLIVGSRVVLAGAVGTAQDLGLSEALVGLILVAVGTSIPEFAISLIATLRRHADVAVGNILGSNIFNLLAILGVSCFLQPLPVHPRILIFDQWVLLGTSLLLLLFLISGRRLTRWEGGVFLAAYGAYCGASFALFPG